MNPILFSALAAVWCVSWYAFGKWVGRRRGRDNWADQAFYADHYQRLSMRLQGEVGELRQKLHVATMESAQERYSRIPGWRHQPTAPQTQWELDVEDAKQRKNRDIVWTENLEKPYGEITFRTEAEGEGS